MLAFLNIRHLIESFHDARKNMPKKLESVSEKCINASVQVNLDPAAVSGSIDIEQFQKVIEINLQLENRLTELEEMIRRGDEKQKIQDLQLRQLEDIMSSKLTQSAHTQTESELSLSAVQDLDNKVDTKLSNYQRSLMEKIDDELKTIGCDVKSIKHCYGMLNTSFHEMENKLISLENNSEKPMRKYNDIKTRIAALERDVMKNSSHIIGLNYSLRSLEWTRPQSFGSPGMFPPDNRCYNEQASFAAAPSYYDMPPTAKPGPSGAVLPPSPPAPPSTSVFCQPLPPAPPAPLSQNIPKKSDSDKSSSSSTAKGEQVYGRIPITTEILKSVVLKPPGERKRVSKPFSAKVEEVSGRTPITAEMLKSVVLKPPGEKKRVSKSVTI